MTTDSSRAFTEYEESRELPLRKTRVWIAPRFAYWPSIRKVPVLIPMRCGPVNMNRAETVAKHDHGMDSERLQKTTKEKT